MSTSARVAARQYPRNSLLSAIQYCYLKGRFQPTLDHVTALNLCGRKACSRQAQQCFSAEDDDKIDPRIRLTLLQKQHHQLRNRQPRQRLGPRMPKGVTEPFTFCFIFAWGIKYLRPHLKQDYIGYDILVFIMWCSTM